MNIIEKVTQAEAVAFDENLHRYRQLLLSDDPEFADELLAVAERLDFDTDRLQADSEIVHLAARLGDQAVDLADHQETHESAFAAAEKHRLAMEKKIAQLQKKQASLDSELSAAQGRHHRAENASRQLGELHKANPTLFSDILGFLAKSDRDRLQDLADSLPSLQADLEQAQEDLEQAEAAADAAIDRCYATTPIAQNKESTIAAKTDAVAHRNSIAARISDLFLKIDRAESARRRLG